MPLLPPVIDLNFFMNIYNYIHGNIPVILAGDFNCVLDIFDRKSNNLDNTIRNNRFEDQSCLHLNDLISNFNLEDGYRSVWPNVSGHTWSRMNNDQSSRIDRVYVSKDFNIVGAETISLPFSDHNPVFVDIRLLNKASGKGYWKYNITLNKNEDFCKDLRFHYTLWCSLKPAFKSIVEWWENVKDRVKELAIKHSIRIAKEKKDYLKYLQHIYTNVSSDEIDQLLNVEVEGAYIRSRANYLDNGEKPSAYFFKLESERGSKKIIRSIRNSDGIIYSDNDNISSIFHEFYSKLYSHDPNCDLYLQDTFINYLDVSLTPSDRDALDSEISLIDVKNALSSTAKNKSPGLDGLPYEFYLNFFDILGHDLVSVFKKIFDDGILSESQRTAVISLTPKKGDTQIPSNWRPISLLNTDYKLLAKILQVRLSKLLPNIINEFQTCAIPGRSIHNNLILIRDLIDYSVLNNYSCALVSIDQEKAFDKVNWDFLKKVLFKLGFGENFMKWISILYNNINSKLLVNGYLSDSIEISRGVRQGCPLSPLLYILFIEPLAKYLNNYNCINGFVLPGGNNKRVKFLQYADDATCVATCVNDIISFFDTFKMFYSATGASINMNKTCGLKIGPLKFCSIPIDINWVEDSIKITGITFCSDILKNYNWDSKLDVATKRLKMWKNRYLSLLGKIVVINTFIFPLFYFVAPVFPVTISVVKDLNKIVFPFILGDKKPDLVKRHVITWSQKDGGLGLDSFQNKMEALFVKPLFLMFNSNSLFPSYLILARFFVAKLLRPIFPHLWSNLRPNSSLCTKTLLYACSIVKRLYSSDVNFNLNCIVTKDIVKNLCKPVHNNEISAVRHNPNFPWARIFEFVFTDILDNKLKDFQWRLAHDILYTGERIQKWGIGDGLCPMDTCVCIETVNHIFWECPKVKPIITWIDNIFKFFEGNDAKLTADLFLYGFPDTKLCKTTFKRLWYLFCTCKFVIWKSRCIHVFESQIHSSVYLLSSIRKRTSDRVLADKHRYSFKKFYSIWIKGHSFVHLKGKSIFCDLPSV